MIDDANPLDNDDIYEAALFHLFSLTGGFVPRCTIGACRPLPPDADPEVYARWMAAVETAVNDELQSYRKRWLAGL